MRIKDLREMLKELGDEEETNEYPVKVCIGVMDEEKQYIELDEQNWELLGTTKEKTFLNIPTHY